MSQITIQLDDHVEQKIMQLANSLNLSIERFIAQLLAQKAEDSWHPSILQLVGAWEKDHEIVLDSSIISNDIARESL